MDIDWDNGPARLILAHRSKALMRAWRKWQRYSRGEGPLLGESGHGVDVMRCQLLTQSGLSGSAQAREALATFAGEDDNLAR